MSKLLALLIVAAAAVLWLGGVFEVTVHPDKLAEVPSVLSNLSQDSQAIDQAVTYLTKFKRRAERTIIQDKEKRLELALLSVRADAEKLRQALRDESPDPSALSSKAELLLSSIEQVRTSAKEAPADTVASLRKESTEAFLAAQEALGQLPELGEEYQDEFNRLSNALEEQIDELGLEKSKSTEGSVAGDQSKKEKGEPDSTQSEIPLKF